MLIARDKLLDDLHRSGLVDEERVSRFLAGQDAESDAETLLYNMVEAGLITPWQSEGLLAGKWKGFFLGKYKLLQLLGQGAMGSVYLAEHRVMRHRVAIKVLAKHLLSTPNIVTRFQREARAAAVINHPNVVRAYDIDQEDDIHFIVMEYVQGEDLKKIVERDGPLDPRTAAEYTQQVARGLHEAHKGGLVHRDIKPANLLLDQTGVVKILDLGLARLEEETAMSASQLGDSKVMGTADYLSPEQAIDSHNIDGRADIYSLGCTLYFLLTGVPPFPTGSVAERMAKHQSRRPADIRKRRPGVPAGIVSICNRMLEKQPDKRFATGGEAAAALGDYLAGRYLSSDEELTLAEDADEASKSSTKLSGQSTVNQRKSGSSTAIGASESSKSVPDNLDLAPQSAQASKPSLPVAKPLPAPSLSPLEELPKASLLGQLKPLEGAPPDLQPLGEPLPEIGKIDDPLQSLDPLASPALGSPLTSAPLGTKAASREPAEKEYPLWKLLAVGLALGLGMVALGALLWFLLS